MSFGFPARYVLVPGEAEVCAHQSLKSLAIYSSKILIFRKKSYERKLIVSFMKKPSMVF